MTKIQKTAVVSAALLAITWAPSCAFAQTNLRDRVAAAIEAVEKTCGDDINAFCSKVTHGEGRLILCMQAHEDQLSRRCQFALYRASRHLENALHRVERLADACWNDIEAQCGDADRIGQCVVQKRASLSRSCQTVVGALQQAVQGLASLRGMSVSSSDDKSIGRVVDIKRGADGKVQSIQVDVGQFLGLGSRVVDINADTFEQLAERIRLRIVGDQVRSLPEVQKQ
jgi:PRC-barrel domain/Cysteine rich repeat